MLCIAVVKRYCPTDTVNFHRISWVTRWTVGSFDDFHVAVTGFDSRRRPEILKMLKTKRSTSTMVAITEDADATLKN